MKNIKDYLHLYLGAAFETSNSVGEINEVTIVHLYDLLERKKGVKLILRPLSDMTEGEKETFIELCGLEPEDIECLEKKRDEFFPAPEMSFGTAHLTNIAQWAIGVKYLLSLHFDIFQLIEAGLAIDRTTLKTVIV